MEHIRLSYILPCYNTGPYIRTCIESLYRQDLPLEDFEVIFVNNATEDNSEEIVKELQKEYANLIYIKLPVNICTGGAYNAGLDVARGKYIQFVDSDDYLKDGVEKPLLEYAEENNLDMVYFNIESFNNDNKLTKEDNLYFNGNFSVEIPVMDGESFIEAYIATKLYETMPVPAYRKLIHRTLFEENKIRFTPTTIGTDCLNNLQLLLEARRVSNVTGKNYMFRYNPSGVTQSPMTPAKDVYGLNNYATAYRYSRRIKRKNIKSTVQTELQRDLSLHMSYLPKYTSEELEYVRKHTYERFTIAMIGGNKWAKLLYTPVELFLFKLKRRMYNMIYRRNEANCEKQVVRI